MNEPVAFPENWTAPRELAVALPREKRLSGLGIFKVAFSAAVVVAAVVLFFLMRREDSDVVMRNRELREQGMQTTAEITRLWHQDRESTPMVAYAFTANGVRMQGASQVPKSLWDHIRVVGMMPVRYLAANPAINHPAGWEESSNAGWFVWIFPSLMLLCAGVFILNVRKQGILASDGVPAPAVITRCYRVKGGWAAKYQFRTKEGAVAPGRCNVAQKLEKGALLCVLYDPARPRRNRIYPLDSYRVG